MPDINKAYSWAIQTCNAPNVGYSNAYRNQQTVGGITYYDCSSFINYALLAGGLIHLIMHHLTMRLQPMMKQKFYYH